MNFSSEADGCGLTGSSSGLNEEVFQFLAVRLDIIWLETAGREVALELLTERSSLLSIQQAENGGESLAPGGQQMI